MKSLVLLSGGLDSLLAVKLLKEQTKVEAVYFILPFIKNNLEDIKNFAEKEKIKLHIINCTSGKLFKEYLQIIKKPHFSRGTALNPCIDCHLFILKKAKELADKLKIKIIATGEVLGERPLSQTKKALELIDKNLGFEILRPLSAKLLKETEHEKRFLDRNKFLAIKGRKRKEQLGLAKKYDLKFPTPAGGCLLCEKSFCEKLKPILNKKISYKDIELLKIGRHFSGIILGKNEKENEILEKEKGIKIIPNQPGPTALLHDKNLVEKAKELIQKYSKNKITEFEIK